VPPILAALELHSSEQVPGELLKFGAADIFREKSAAVHRAYRGVMQ
jgi:hypothetical protein